MEDIPLIPSIMCSLYGGRGVPCILQKDIEAIVVLLEGPGKFLDRIEGRELKDTDFSVLEASFILDGYRKNNSED